MSLYGRLFFLVGWLMYASCFSQEVEDTTKLREEEELYKKAVKLIDSAKYKDALSELKKAIKINPEYWQVYNKMAVAKIKLGQAGDAGVDLQKVLTYDPNNFEALKNLGILYFDAKKFKESKMFFDSAASQKVDDAEFFLYRAKLMFLGKAYKEALDMASYALEADPKLIDAYILKGEVRFARKEYNYTIKELNDATKLMKADKPNYDIYKLRARSKFEIQDYKGAVTDWNVYIDAFPKDKDALIQRAAARINSDDYTNAIVDLDAALKLDPKNPVIYNHRGVAKGGNKQYVEALKDLDYAIKLKFDYAPAYVNRAYIKFASKDKRGACEDLSKADGLGDNMAYKLIEQYCKTMQQ